MALLADNDRAFILAQLTLAPDEILADAMLAFNAVRDKIIKVRALSAAAGTKEEPEVPYVSMTTEDVKHVLVSRPNVPPSGPVAKRLYMHTKNTILNRLEDGVQPNEQLLPQAKLLWSRGEIKYDGEKFYL